MSVRRIVSFPALICLLVGGANLLPPVDARGLTKPKQVRPKDNPPQYAAFARPLDPSLDAVHLLDRLTFGPRQGDLRRLNEIGFDRWLTTQLHPEQLGKTPELEAKLQPYQSLTMSPRDAVLHYPPPRFIAAVARGNAKLPDDPELRVIVASLAERYLQKKGTADPGVSTSGRAAENEQAGVQGRVPLSAILGPAQIDQLKNGTPLQKSAILTAIPDEQRMNFAWALPLDQRRGLFPLAPVVLRRDLMLSVNPQRVIQDDLSEAKILRAVYSSHQVEELLVDFWFNHFNVFLDKGADHFLVPSYERAAIRPHVFGRFYDLLLATAQSPAMLFYLDNWQSVGPDAKNTGDRKRGLNENYGRELLELHTLGVDGGYTQRDVIEVARCFTGWTIKRPNQGGGFEFNDKVHDKGQKLVLGHVIPAGGGMNDGLRVLEILSQQPATAHFISLKLARRFVADDPPPSLVNRMAQTFLKKKGDLREVLLTMFHSPEFWSEGSYRAKVKTPLELVASALRATGAHIDSAFVLENELQKLGEPLYRKIEPTGYSSANAEWMNSAALLERLNFGLALSRNHVAGVKIDPAALVAGSSDPMSVAAALLNVPPSVDTQKTIQQALETPAKNQPVSLTSAPLQSRQNIALVVGLTLGSPDFQRR